MYFENRKFKAEIHRNLIFHFGSKPPVLVVSVGVYWLDYEW